MPGREGRQLGPSGSRRQRAMRLFGMSLKSSAPPRQTGPSVNDETAGDAVDGSVGRDEVVQAGIADLERCHGSLLRRVTVETG